MKAKRSKRKLADACHLILDLHEGIEDHRTTGLEVDTILLQKRLGLLVRVIALLKSTSTEPLHAPSQGAVDRKRLRLGLSSKSLSRSRPKALTAAAKPRARGPKDLRRRRPLPKEAPRDPGRQSHTSRGSTLRGSKRLHVAEDGTHRSARELQALSQRLHGKSQVTPKALSRA